MVAFLVTHYCSSVFTYIARLLAICEVCGNWNCSLFASSIPLSLCQRGVLIVKHGNSEQLKLNFLHLAFRTVYLSEWIAVWGPDSTLSWNNGTVRFFLTIQNQRWRHLYWTLKLDSLLLCHRPFMSEEMTVSANRCGQVQADVDQPWLSICVTMPK